MKADVNIGIYSKCGKYLIEKSLGSTVIDIDDEGNFDIPISKKEEKEWKDGFKMFDKTPKKSKKIEEDKKMKCKHCKSKNIVELKNGNFLCLDCREEFKTEKQIEVIDPDECELVKIHRFKDDYYIKINTVRGNRFFKKVKGYIYEEFKYVDYDVFEQQSLDNRVDFKKALEVWLG